MFYRTTETQIKGGHQLFDWCAEITSLANNLSNAVRFRQRQVYTMAGKKPSEYTDNEKGVLAEFRLCFGEDYTPSFKHISANAMEKLLRQTNNPDFFAKGLPKQAAQHVVSLTCKDMETHFHELQDWMAEPEKYTGRPQLPGYKKKGGRCTVEITNEDCTVKAGKDGMLYAGLPFAKKTPLPIGKPEGRLKHVTVTPSNGIFLIRFVFEVDRKEPKPADTPSRIASIDFGVDNLMAVANNCGIPCLLYKGGIIKSENQWYNKELARIMAEETARPGCPKGKDGMPKFYPTPASMALTMSRNNAVRDYMRKSACHFIHWCVENRIDTVVAGINRGWKQEVNIGRVNNQNFVQIPFAYLKSILAYKCLENGIRYVEQEESYTSKASFLDADPIPVYGQEGDTPVVFSGKRRPTSYKGMTKRDGFRGLYVSADGTVINSDLNGSANILRKWCPAAFETGKMPDFENVVIIRDADREFGIANRMKQTQVSRNAVSHAKAGRLKRKIVGQRKSNPTGIGLCG